jgi:hypothetical protein
VDRTVLDLPVPQTAPIPPRPTCPSWCRPGACDVRYDEHDGWVGAHAENLQTVTAGELWWSIQLQQLVAPGHVYAPGVVMDTNAYASDPLDADTAEALAAALLSGTVRLRQANRPTVAQVA